MRTVLTCVLVSAAIAIAGCGGGGTTTPPEDMAIAPDLTVIPPDMTVFPDMTPPPLSCSGVVGCIQNCRTMACQQDCLGRASESATMKLNDLLACGFATCTKADADSGVKPCSGPNDSSQGCQDCIAGSAAGACNPQLLACLGD